MATRLKVEAKEEEQDDMEEGERRKPQHDEGLEEEAESRLASAEVASDAVEMERKRREERSARKAAWQRQYRADKKREKEAAEFRLDKVDETKT